MVQNQLSISYLSNYNILELIFMTLPITVWAFSFGKCLTEEKIKVKQRRK